MKYSAWAITPLVQFSSCSVNEGKTAEDAHRAHKQFSDFMMSNGGQAASWILWPALGAGDIDFDYYSVSAYDSYAQLGRAFEAYANGGGWQKAQQELYSVVTCDNPRLYNGILVRDGTGGYCCMGQSEWRDGQALLRSGPI